jgi:hydroxymethylbilane synthase
MVASLDGQTLIKDQTTGKPSAAEAIGRELAEKLRQQGAGEILAAIFAEIQR